MTSALRERAPAKVNLCLFLGPTRADGLHEIVTVVEPLSLADELELALDPSAVADAIHCPGVPEPNLAGAALAAFREAAAWEGSPVRVTIDKRIPVAAGMGGGSSDAAATLRLAARAAGRGDDLLAEIAPRLGSDVPALLKCEPAMVVGAGERLHPLAPLRPHGLVVLPSRNKLSAGEVYAEADRLGLARSEEGLAQRRADVERALADGELPPLVNDLEPAAHSLCPSIEHALAALCEAGADQAIVTGSGPTAFGIFTTRGAAREAAACINGAIEAVPA
ncbi:MAG: 4-(cytidine 5'-diphospho)-2-C-methyl-D-erythritol kinase [Solirubrobacteraceae bacterium]